MRIDLGRDVGVAVPQDLLYLPERPSVRQDERRGGVAPLAPRTLKKLEEIAAKVREHGGANLEPMQLAALLIEKTTEKFSEEDAENLLRPKRRASR